MVSFLRVLNNVWNLMLVPSWQQNQRILASSPRLVPLIFPPLLVTRDLLPLLEVIIVTILRIIFIITIRSSGPFKPIRTHRIFRIFEGEVPDLREAGGEEEIKGGGSLGERVKQKSVGLGRLGGSDCGKYNVRD